MARKKNKIEQKEKTKRFFRRNWTFPILMSIVVVLALVFVSVFTWLYQTRNIIWSIGSETITKPEVALEIQRLKPPDYETKMKSITDPKDRKDAEYLFY